MPPEHPEELAIAQAILAKDEAVAAAFFEKCHPKVYHFVLSRLGNADDAEEVSQDTWVTAIESLEHYRGGSTLLTWICAIARFKISDRFRRQQRNARQTHIEEFEHALDSLLQGGQVTGLSVGDAAHTRGGILDLLEREEVREALDSTLALLPQDYRTALCMKYLDGASVREIAEVLGRGEKAADSVLNRAKAAFRDLWRVESGEVIAVRGRRGKRPGGQPPPRDA